jgi:hypothetical protein
VWSDELAAGAKTWADHVAALGTSVHSTTQGYGENIAWRGIGGDTLTPMVESWVNEKNGYTVAPFQWDRDVTHAHYTAMVWGTTTEVGCGMATGSVNDFLVCRYSPPGHYDGQLPYGQGAAPAVAEEDAGAPLADQAVGDEDAGAPLADQAVGDEDAGAPLADQAVGDGGGDGGGGDTSGDGGGGNTSGDSGGNEN